MLSLPRKAAGPEIIQYQFDEIVTSSIRIGDFIRCIWNEYNLKPLTSNYWRASLVPASAVIPAPRAYLKIVAVKKPVVEIRFMGPHTQGSNLCGLRGSQCQRCRRMWFCCGRGVKASLVRGPQLRQYVRRGCHRSRTMIGGGMAARQNAVMCVRCLIRCE